MLRKSIIFPFIASNPVLKSRLDRGMGCVLKYHVENKTKHFTWGVESDLKQKDDV